MTAPQYALVKLPDNVTFEQAARFGYTGHVLRRDEEGERRRRASRC